jgi:hypothetical protein
VAAEHDLAALIVDAAAQRTRGERVIGNRADDLARLVIELGVEGDVAFGRFFEELAHQLQRRGVRLPPVDELPASIAPLLALFEESFIYDKSGELDAERTATRLDASLKSVLGTSPREARRAQLEAEIRKDVSESVAESLRRHGLVPAADDQE